jgi:serine/threonine protein phosphatase PrpC
VTTCPNCGEPVAADARFCEACGTDLSDGSPGEPLVVKNVEPDLDPEATPAAAPAPAVCASCGGTIAPDGYCEQCGLPAQSERDHWREDPADWVGGVCDRGIRHSVNEDAMALAADTVAGSFAAIVVCDGVSSTPDSDRASLAAARAAKDLLVEGHLSDQAYPPDPKAAVARWSERLVEAGARASAAIFEAIGDMAERPNPPSCTFVAAVIEGPLVVVAGVGDSRAYWIPDEGHARQLSTDDSWAQEMMAQGMPRQQAESAPKAHSITRWLGADSTDEVPHCVPTFPAAPGWVLVCSDGLWNYCSDAVDLAELVHNTAEKVGSTPSAISASLVAWANEQGGQDNITVALARFDGAGFDSVSSELSTSPVAGA